MHIFNFITTLSLYKKMSSHAFGVSQLGPAVKQDWFKGKRC